jgi:hypothetical protein
MGSIDISTFLWVLGAGLGIIGSLVAVLWTVAWGAIKENREILSELNRKLSERVEGIYERIERERDERITRHDEGMNRAFSEVKEVQELVGDMRETVAGFGTVYVTRQECVEKHRGT